MSSFEQSINQREQFIIAVKIFQPVKSKEEFDEVARTATNYRALVDTGANRCCISEKVVADLNLQAVRHSEMMTAGKTHIAPVYRVGIAVSVMETKMLPEKQEDGRVALKPHQRFESSKGFPRIKVSTLPDVGTDRGFDVIVGMDMLIHFHITICHGKIIISI